MKTNKKHQKYFGYQVPQNYFEDGPKKILDQIEELNTRNTPKLGRYMMSYAIAASLALIIGLGVFSYYDNHSNNKNDLNATITLNAYEDAFIESLSLNDNELDSYFSEFITEEIVSKSSYSKNNPEDLILNSLFINDSLLDEYMENEIIDNIIL